MYTFFRWFRLVSTAVHVLRPSHSSLHAFVAAAYVRSAMIMFVPTWLRYFLLPACSRQHPRRSFHSVGECDAGEGAAVSGATKPVLTMHVAFLQLLVDRSPAFMRSTWNSHLAAALFFFVTSTAVQTASVAHAAVQLINTLSSDPKKVSVEAVPWWFKPRLLFSTLSRQQPLIVFHTNAGDGSTGGVDIAMVDPSGNVVSNGSSTVTVPGVTGVGAVGKRCDRDRAVPVVMLRTVRASVSPEFGLVARN